MRGWTHLHTPAVILGALLGLGLGACFEEPGGDVTFACDPISANTCPDGYLCQADGCCHARGTDYLDNEGACRLGDGGGFDADGSGGDETSGGGDSTGGDTSGGDTSGG